MKRMLPLLLLVVACRPTLDEDLSHVDGPRILAVAADPPEALPNKVVTMRALYTDGTTALSWDFCIQRPALAEPTELSAACLDGDPTALVSLGAGQAVPGTIPADVCRRFGPEQPLASTAGQPAGRPFDPDATGGYYLPGLVHAPGADDATFSVRIQCGLPGATQEQTSTYQQTYLPNQNPVLADVTLRGQSVADGATATAAPNEAIAVDASWPDCPDPTKSCPGAETFPVFDPSARVLTTQREGMRVSWLATRGHFADVRSGRDGTDLTRDVSTTFTAPADGDAQLWFVLRDTRGGTSFRSLRIHVQ